MLQLENEGATYTNYRGCKLVFCKALERRRRSILQLFFSVTLESTKKEKKMQTLRLISNLEEWGSSETFSTVRKVTVENGDV